MSALPPDETRTMLAGERRAAVPLGSLAYRWEQLQTEGAQLAQMADLAAEDTRASVQTFAALFADASDWQRELAREAIEDIDAVMQPGLTALRTITARGQDAGVPALALWREFHAAREAILGVLSNNPAEAALGDA